MLDWRAVIVPVLNEAPHAGARPRVDAQATARGRARDPGRRRRLDRRQPRHRRTHRRRGRPHPAARQPGAGAPPTRSTSACARRAGPTSPAWTRTRAIRATTSRAASSGSSAATSPASPGPNSPVGDGPTGRAVALALAEPARRRWRALPPRAARGEEDVDSGSAASGGATCSSRSAGWDEDWPVNQDAELAARIRARGGRIVCLPEMAAEYAPRSRLRGARAASTGATASTGPRPRAVIPRRLRRSHVLPPGLVAAVACAAVPVRRARPLRVAVALYGGHAAGRGLACRGGGSRGRGSRFA